jgi:hypothetical protein
VKEFYPSTNPLPVEGYAKNTAALDLWFNSSGWELRLGYKYHSPFSIIAGWNGSDRAVTGRGNHPRLQRLVPDERNVRHPAAGEQSHQRAAAIWRDNSQDRLGSYDVYGRRALLDFTFKF